MAISREVGDRNYVIHSTVLLGFSALHLGDYATAIRQAQAGIDDMGQFGYVRDAALARLLLGSAQLAQGEPDTAYQTLNQAIALYRTIAHPDELGWALAVQLYVLRALGRTSEIQPMVVEAIQTVLTAQGFNAVATLLPILALQLFDLGQIGLAVAITTQLDQTVFVQQSVWFAQVADEELNQRLATLPATHRVVPESSSITRSNSNHQELLLQAAHYFGAS